MNLESAVNVALGLISIIGVVVTVTVSLTIMKVTLSALKDQLERIGKVVDGLVHIVNTLMTKVAVLEAIHRREEEEKLANQ